MDPRHISQGFCCLVCLSRVGRGRRYPIHFFTSMSVRISNLVALSISAFVIVCALGCSDIEMESSTHPTKEQVRACRDAMSIQDALVITPIGYFRQPDFQFDTLALKFEVQTRDADGIFDPAVGAPTSLLKRETKPGFGRTVPEPWWSPDSGLIGVDLEQISSASGETRDLSIRIDTAENESGKLVVYVYARVNH